MINDWNSYNIVNLIINFLVAIGTIGACWISLKQGRIKIKSNFYFGHILDINGDTDNTEYSTVSIINKSNRTIGTNYFAFFYAYSKNDKFAIIQNPIHPLNNQLINPECSKTYTLCEKSKFYEMCKEKELNIKKLKLFVRLESGDVFEIKNFRKSINYS